MAILDRNDTINTPVLWVNRYLQEKLALDVGIGVPFFPTTPSNIDDLTEQWVTITPNETNQRFTFAGVMATWDRLFRRRTGAFPHIKCEQVIYYFYATKENVTENMIKTQEEIYRLFDRGDESAEEINTWIKERLREEGGVREDQSLPPERTNIIPPAFYFHTFKVYQLEEVRDIIDFGTARTYGGNKIIIEFDYHQAGTTTNSDGSKDPGPLKDTP